MENDDGIKVDLYIPRKWYEYLIFIFDIALCFATHTHKSTRKIIIFFFFFFFFFFVFQLVLEPLDSRQGPRVGSDQRCAR
jgi:hypothetical protein